MSTPPRSQEQRTAALDAALAARRERSRLRAALKSGEVRAHEVLGGAAGNPVWAGLRVRWLLECVPGIGPARAEHLMSTLKIAPTRRVQGLGERQRAALASALEAR